MLTFDVPKREDVPGDNQKTFDHLKKAIGSVPNLYAVLAYSETALADFLAFEARKSTLNKKEKEVINLAVSEINGCRYCLSVHTAIAKLNGFTDDQVLDIRSGSAPFDPKLDALAHFTRDITINRGKPTSAVVNGFFDAGYTRANVIDVILIIAGKIVTNFTYGVTNVPIDFPLAPELETVE